MVQQVCYGRALSCGLFVQEAPWAVLAYNKLFKQTQYRVSLLPTLNQRLQSCSIRLRSHPPAVFCQTNGCRCWSTSRLHAESELPCDWRTCKTKQWKHKTKKKKDKKKAISERGFRLWHKKLSISQSVVSVQIQEKDNCSLRQTSTHGTIISAERLGNRFSKHRNTRECVFVHILLIRYPHDRRIQAEWEKSCFYHPHRLLVEFV